MTTKQFNSRKQLLDYSVKLWIGTKLLQFVYTSNCKVNASATAIRVFLIVILSNCNSRVSFLIVSNKISTIKLKYVKSHKCKSNISIWSWMNIGVIRGKKCKRLSGRTKAFHDQSKIFGSLALKFDWSLYNFRSRTLFMLRDLLKYVKSYKCKSNTVFLFEAGCILA